MGIAAVRYRKKLQRFTVDPWTTKLGLCGCPDTWTVLSGNSYGRVPSVLG